MKTKKIRKKLLGFDVGMTYYSMFEKDEEEITIPFVVSLSITSFKIVELLPKYLECLKRNECPEVLDIFRLSKVKNRLEMCFSEVKLVNLSTAYNRSSQIIYQLPKSPISSIFLSLAIPVRLTFSRFETIFSYRGTVVS